MAFNLNELKQEKNKNTELNNSKVQKFIDKFEEEIESEKFEDWLQEELKRTSKEGIMYFSIGTSGNEAGYGKCNEFIIFGQYSFRPIISLKLPQYIELGRPTSSYRSEPEYVKKYNEYIDAMNTCYKNLITRLKGLGLKVESRHPNFDIDYSQTVFKVIVTIEEE